MSNQAGHSRKHNQKWAVSGGLDIGAAFTRARNTDPSKVTSNDFLFNSKEVEQEPPAPNETPEEREARELRNQARRDPDALMAEYVRNEFDITKGQQGAAVQIADYVMRHDCQRPEFKILQWLALDYGDELMGMKRINQWIVKTATPFVKSEHGEIAARAVRDANDYLESDRKSGHHKKWDKTELQEAFWHACVSAQTVRKWQKAGGINI